ncbi:MAG: SDR family oxidoreductase [Armatimonadota bacterium]
MDLGLQGKVALVAAGSKGIGLATAKMLADEGCRVSICGRNQESLDQATKQIDHGAIGLVCDVSSLTDIDRWIAESTSQLGPIDIMVTNTGGPPAGSWQTITDEQWQAGFDSTLMNVVRMVRAVAPGMKERGWGRIVHNTSLVAKEPNALLPISSTLRAGLMALTRLQALELAPFGITVNGVLPGHTLTDRQIHLAEIRGKRDGLTVDEALDLQASEVPMKRLGKPEEIASAIAFFCSQPGAYITGTSLLVDGGMTKGLG